MSRIRCEDGDTMEVTKEFPEVRAVHRDGVLELLDALDLPEGAQVRLLIRPEKPEGTGTKAAAFVYPTRLVPAERSRRTEFGVTSAPVPEVVGAATMATPSSGSGSPARWAAVGCCESMSAAAALPTSSTLPPPTAATTSHSSSANRSRTAFAAATSPI